MTFLPLRAFTGLVLASLLWPRPSWAASPAPETAAPQLLSRTGGGGESWADLPELRAAVARGNPRAQAQLGEMLLRGDGVPRDDQEAVRLLEAAARSGHGGAAFRLGMLLSRGQAGVAEDPERALAYFRAAAAGGEAEAFFNIGAAYASARGVKRDYAEALGWLMVARQRGADAGAERALREQIRSRPTWIATGEKRAVEIAAEFKDRKVTDFLPPPAPLDTRYDPLRPVLPTLPTRRP
ncbi:MAG: sel1 repeat family protein [Verrucomicrobia bacterium]|nr:sel1 repeat family protein [Verrucomicrobiota bacterium]